MRRPILLAALLALGLSAPARAAPKCGEACLNALADRVIVALAKKDYRSLPWADPVRFSENNVSMMLGDAMWGSAGKTPGRKAFALADAETGNVVWFGTLWDHDAPGFGAIRIKAVDGKIAEMEAIVARKPNPHPFGDPLTFAVDPAAARTLPAASRRTRDRLIDIADAFLATKQRNDGTLFAAFTPDCAMKENGISITHGKAGPGAMAQGCEAQFKLGLHRPVERVRDRRFPVVDPEHGLVVAISMQDWPQRDTSFRTTDGREVSIAHAIPQTRAMVELIRIDGDRVAGSDAVTAYLPYRMPTPWKE